MFRGKLAFFLIISALAIKQHIRRCSAEPLHGVNFIGIGYNILEGNPEGGDLRTGGVDPGLLLSRKIFKFTYEEGKTTSDQKNQIPDEVKFVPRESAFTTLSRLAFYGTKSYASKLSAQVEVSGGYEGVLASVKFAASARYKAVAEKTSGEGSVFLSKETITNLGHARYMKELALSDNYLLSNGFVADACRLPATYTDETKTDYMEFMDEWGTHVVSEVDLGVRKGVNMEETRSSFVNYASQNVEGSISVGGAYGGASASLSVNMESFNSAMENGTNFGKIYNNYTIGSKAHNEPISVTLIAMPEVFESDFWTGLDDYIAAGRCTTSFDKDRVKANLDSALRDYGEYHKITASSNPDIRVPLTWPEGVYGLPEPFNGCPTEDWNEGHRIQGTSNGEGSERSNFKIFAGWSFGKLARRDFCMKTVSSTPGSKWQWQPGSYCIFKYGSRCPRGLTSGYIHWADQNKFPDMSMNYGVVPSGTYGEDTEINFCCRNDGVTSRPIYLPTDENFMLLARFDKCQLVHNMSVKKEWIYWNTGGNSQQSEVHPGDGVYETGVRLVYCYYHIGDTIEYPPDLESTQLQQLRDDVSKWQKTLCDRHPSESCTQ